MLRFVVRQYLGWSLQFEAYLGQEQSSVADASWNTSPCRENMWKGGLWLAMQKHSRFNSFGCNMPMESSGGISTTSLRTFGSKDCAESKRKCGCIDSSPQEDEGEDAAGEQPEMKLSKRAARRRRNKQRIRAEERHRTSRTNSEGSCSASDDDYAGETSRERRKAQHRNPNEEGPRNDVNRPSECARVASDLNSPSPFAAAASSARAMEERGGSSSRLSNLESQEETLDRVVSLEVMAAHADDLRRAADSLRGLHDLGRLGDEQAMEIIRRRKVAQFKQHMRHIILDAGLRTEEELDEEEELQRQCDESTSHPQDYLNLALPQDEAGGSERVAGQYMSSEQPALPYGSAGSGSLPAAMVRGVTLATSLTGVRGMGLQSDGNRGSPTDLLAAKSDIESWLILCLATVLVGTAVVYCFWFRGEVEVRNTVPAGVVQPIHKESQSITRAPELRTGEGTEISRRAGRAGRALTSAGRARTSRSGCRGSRGARFAGCSSCSGRSAWQALPHNSL